MIHLRTLGGAGLTRADGVEVRSVLAQPKRFALLVHLALAGGFVRRDVLLALFWPEADEERARGALRTGLHFLRRSLGSGVVVSRGSDEVGIGEGRLRCDAADFAAAVAADRSEEALALYAGPLLPGFSAEGAPGWDDWLDRERARLARLAADAAWTLAARAEGAGDAAGAAEWARRAVEAAPDEEEPVRRLMELHGRLGDRAAALRAYDLLAGRMEREHGAAPSPRTRALAERLRAEDASPSPDRPDREDGSSPSPADASSTLRAPVSSRPPNVDPPVPSRPSAPSPNTCPLVSPNSGGGENLNDVIRPVSPESGAESAADAVEVVSSVRAEMTGVGAAETTPPSTSSRSRSVRSASTGAASRPERRRRALLLAAALAALCVGLAAGARGVSGATGGASPEAPPSVAAGVEEDGHLLVLPFAVRGYTRYDYLGEGMVDLLSATLDGAGELRAVDPRAVLAAAPAEAREVAPEEGRRLAGRFHARFYVLGGIVAGPDRLQVSASLYDRARGEAPVAVSRVEGSADRVFELVDALAAELLAGRPAGPGERLERAAARTTESLPALRAHLRGASALRAGRFGEAAEGFAAALAEDSTFALAAYGLSLAADGAGVPSSVADPMGLALRHAERLSDRDRRLLEARAAYVGPGGPAEAARLYRELLALYPSDVDAWYHLADIVFHWSPREGRPFTEARGPLERALAFDPHHPSAIQHLARIEAWEGNAEALDSLTRRGLRRASGDLALELLAHRAVSLGDAAARDRLLRELRGTGDNRVWITAWRAAVFAADPSGAAPLLATLTEPARLPEARAMGHASLALLALAGDRRGDAAAHFAAAERTAPGVAARIALAAAADPLTGRCDGPLLPGVPAGDLPPRPSLPTLVSAARGPGAPLDPPPGYAQALLAACRGDAVRALALADSLARRVPHGAALADQVRAHVVRADSAAAAGDVLERLPTEDANLFSGAHQRWLRAELLRREGRWVEALSWYGALVADLDPAGLPYRAPAELRQAELLRRLGRPDDARRHERRLARLRGGGG